jgi:hypothetical protein
MAEERLKVAAKFVDSGEQSLKNIERPVRVYRLDLEQMGVSGFAAPRPALALSDTIAVLAFTNMSRDPEQEYFSDGISEDNHHRSFEAVGTVRHCAQLIRACFFSYRDRQ